MLPVEDWEKAGPTQPDTIERKTIRKTREVFMTGTSVRNRAVRSDPAPTHGLNIKPFRYLAPTKTRHGERCPESADRREDYSISRLSIEPFSGRDLYNLFPAMPEPGSSHRARCKPARCNKAEPNATPKAAAFR